MSSIFVAYDLETTGLRPNKDRIISIGWIIFNSRFNILSQKECIVNPQIDIHPQASEVNGFTKDRNGNLRFRGKLVTKNLMELDEAMEIFIEEIEEFAPKGNGKLVYLAHNGHIFDHPLLKAEARRCGRMDYLPDGIWSDTLPIARAVYPGRGHGGYRLQTLGEDLLNTQQTHSAKSDALLMSRLFYKMFKDCDAEKYPVNLVGYDTKHYTW